MIAAANASVASQRMPPTHNRHPSLANLPLHGFDHTYGGMAAAMGHRGTPHGLPKLETAQSNDPTDFNLGLQNGLRTAPPMATLPQFDFEQLLFNATVQDPSTINPNALHYNDSPPSMVMDTSQFPPSMVDLPSSHQHFDDNNFNWLLDFDSTMSFENVMDESSPSALSTASQSGISDNNVMLDGSNNKAPAATSAMWTASLMGPPQMPNPFAMDLNGSVFPDLLAGAPMSPQPASATQKTNDPYFSTPPPSLSSIQNIDQTFGFNASTDPPSTLSGGNNGASPVTTITDATRHAIVNALSQCPPFGRKYSLSQNSPQSPGVQSFPGQVPSTQDLQRYVAAYLAFFHPHFPFLHYPTLSFDPHSSQMGRTNGIGGSGCLILSMAAIGALYEMNHDVSMELFLMAKKMILYYLEDRRKGDVRKVDARRGTPGTDQMPVSQENPMHTPVWLVQAMLLNVVYGHNCGDKTASDIASTHCTALVSLAQSADLLRPTKHDALMLDDPWNVKTEQEEQIEWLQWKLMEERKRTLYAVFIMSSLLVSAYNHTPALTNSEIHLDLPCDEEFFSAESSSAFAAKGGVVAANHNRITFHDALGDLLRTNERQHQMGSNNNVHGQFGSNSDMPKSDLKPSTSGCLILINALHNYIWETRQRHHNKVWTNEETEKMHRHIEPALKAWQAAWASNPHHSLERPNPFGEGPLSADAIPLLDLAYVRLFVNLSRSKEKFWQRDWDGMAEELSRGVEIVQHAEHSPANSDSTGTDPSDLSIHSSVFVDTPTSSNDAFADKNCSSGGNRNCTRREKHLRKAASYAADSFAMSNKYGVTFADYTSRELPLQSALCAFDCAQVLAEWLATLQDRVGQYLGILGQDDVAYAEVPAIMLLEEEDIKLLKQVQNILTSTEEKIITDHDGGDASSIDGWRGYATRILRVTSYCLDRAAVWPVTRLMARCLETHATHTRTRAEQSIVQAE